MHEPRKHKETNKQDGTVTKYHQHQSKGAQCPGTPSRHFSQSARGPIVNRGFLGVLRMDCAGTCSKAGAGVWAGDEKFEDECVCGDGMLRESEDAMGEGC